jgi:hypothetical protein
MDIVTLLYNVTERPANHIGDVFRIKRLEGEAALTA